MPRRFSTLILSIVLIAALSACNLPNGDSVDETATPDFSLTLTALAAPSNTPLPQDTPLPVDTATPEFTATPSVPQVTVSVNTNCRTGPSTQYEQTDALLVGQTATVVGKNTSTGYWIINRLNGAGTCWLWGNYATVTGNTTNLPEYPVPPTPTPSATPTSTPTPTLAAPQPVNNPTMAMVCIPNGPNFNHSGVLNWEDKSDNETGFNIYVNGALIATVAANATTYNFAPFGPFAPGIASIFGVEAYNAAGKAAIKTVTKGCP